MTRCYWMIYNLDVEPVAVAQSENEAWRRAAIIFCEDMSCLLEGVEKQALQKFGYASAAVQCTEFLTEVPEEAVHG